MITNPQHSCNSYYTVGHYQAFKKTTPVATLSYIQATADTSANTDAGDKYTGLDRFERVIDQVWRSVAGSGTIMDRYQYGYDRAGNRLFKNNLLDTALSELYGYDNLNQTTSFSRGVLSEANSDGMFDTVASSSRTQAWNLDALGNWANLTTNSTSQSRTHNAQNQVTGVGSTSLTYDSNGSMTADESGRVFVYDAWNRLAAVRNSSNSPIVTYSIDALGRRITEDRPNANTVDHLYYSTGWQVLEERRGGTSSGDIRRQYFWSIDYVDALTARVDYASGAVSATYHAQYDANWNITAIADATSGIVERYTYDPYGVVTVLYANWSVRGGSPYGWNYLHQGGRLDVDSNLYHFRNRDYSATLGRWTQTDPIGFEAGDTNLYRYVGNGPVNGVDPSGLFGDSWDWIYHPGRPAPAPPTTRIKIGGPSVIPKALPGKWKIGIYADEGHAWIRYQCISDPSGTYKPGEVHTTGKYPEGRGGMQDPDGIFIVPPAAVPGVQWDLDRKREPGLGDDLKSGRISGREVILDNPKKYRGSNGGFGYTLGFNNCTSYAADAWRHYSGERLDTRPGPPGSVLPDWPKWLKISIDWKNSPEYPPGWALGLEPGR